MEEGGIHRETQAERILQSILSDDDSGKILPMSSELTLAGRSGHSTFGSDPDSSLQSCLVLLSSFDLDQNRVGLQRLMLLTTGRALSGLHRSHELASYVVVYGGQLGSVEDRLRYVFATMICDAPHDDRGMLDQNAFNLSDVDDNEESTNPRFDDESLDVFEFDNVQGDGDDFAELHTADDGQKGCVGEDRDDQIEKENDAGDDGQDSYSSDEDDSGEQGKAWGALHLQALRVLANALTRVVNSSEKEIAPVPLHDTIWRNILQALVKNVENNSNADITGYSLKILRMIHSIHPETTQPLLRQTLFPHLVYLSEYGEGHQFPMIYKEALYLLKRAQSQ